MCVLEGETIAAVHFVLTDRLALLCISVYALLNIIGIYFVLGRYRAPPALSRPHESLLRAAHLSVVFAAHLPPLFLFSLFPARRQ